MRPLAPPRLVAALVTALGARAALAQPSPVELARNELIRQAEEAARRGDHALAVERARRAVELRATPSVQHFLAREHEAMAQPLEALAFASACERGAEADPTVRSRDALLRTCRAIAERATLRLGRVVVRVAPPLPDGLVVRVGGGELPPALLGVPYPVTPGVVRVEAEAPGREPARLEVSVEAGHVEEVDVTLPLPAPPPPRVEATPTPAPAPAPTPIPLVVRGPAPRRAVPSRVPWITVGAGLSGLAVATFAVAGVYYGLASEAQSARDAACASPCAATSAGFATAAGQNERYHEHLAVTSGLLVAGALAATGATLWWVLARPSARRLEPLAVALPGGALAGVTAVW